MSDEKLAQALREIIDADMQPVCCNHPERHPDTGEPLACCGSPEPEPGPCAQIAIAALADHDSARAQPDRAPDGYAYRYPWHTGGTVIRFSNGEEINGSKPLEVIPYYYGQPPAQPASVGDGFVSVPARIGEAEADVIGMPVAWYERAIRAASGLRRTFSDAALAQENGE